MELRDVVIVCEKRKKKSQGKGRSECWEGGRERKRGSEGEKQGGMVWRICRFFFPFLFLINSVRWSQSSAETLVKTTGKEDKKGGMREDREREGKRNHNKINLHLQRQDCCLPQHPSLLISAPFCSGFSASADE